MVNNISKEDKQKKLEEDLERLRYFIQEEANILEVSFEEYIGYLKVIHKYQEEYHKLLNRGVSKTND